MKDMRKKMILPYIKGKTVLDLGPGDLGHRQLHPFIHENSEEVVGVELSRSRAEPMIKQGYNIIIGNAENVSLKRKFDVVIAGDLIEHLNNPGLFLENVKRHMKEGGVFICNTPNIYSINMVLRGLFLGGNVRQFPEHSMGFNEQLVRELFKRHKLRVTKVIYFSHKENNLRSMIIRMFSFLSKKWSEHICIIAKKSR